MDTIAGLQTRAPRRIELNLANVNQLFNTMDPSPFRERDLDRDAEEFIVGWAREFPLREPVELVVHLAEQSAGQEGQTARRCTIISDTGRG